MSPKDRDRSFGATAIVAVAGAVGVALTALIVLYCVNYWDQTLGSAPAVALNARHDLVPPAQNAYYPIRDLPAVTGSLTGVCDLHEGTSCLDAARANEAQWSAAIDANRALIERYAGLAGLAQFEDPVPLTLTSPVISWGKFLAAKRLLLAGAALQARQGKISEALRTWRRDVEFTRRMLAQGDVLLIDKVIFATSLRESLHFISALVRRQSLADSDYEAIQAALRPLAEDERTLAGVFSREFTGLASMLAEVPPSGLQGHFFKSNATLNDAWADVARNQADSRAPCSDLAAHRLDVGPERTPFWRYAYNPVGRILVSVGRDSRPEYLLTMCDLAGIRNLVALQVTLARGHVAEADLPQRVATAAADERNPYDGGPFRFDANARTLTFAPTATRDQRYLPWPI